MGGVASRAWAGVYSGGPRGPQAAVPGGAGGPITASASTLKSSLVVTAVCVNGE